MLTDDQARDMGRRALAAGFKVDAECVMAWQESRSMHKGAVSREHVHMRHVEGAWLILGRRYDGWDDGFKYHPDQYSAWGHDSEQRWYGPDLLVGDVDGAWYDPPWPDFRDTATASVLREWVRGLWGSSSYAFHLHISREIWVVYAMTPGVMRTDIVAEGPTEVAAWLAAAEAKGTTPA